MPKKLEVYGTMKMCSTPMYGQFRLIVAASSKAEACRLMDMTTREFNHAGSITGNEMELQTALAHPGVVFMNIERAFYAIRSNSSRWEMFMPQNKYEALCARLIVEQCKIHDGGTILPKHTPAYGVLSDIMAELHADGYDLRTGRCERKGFDYPPGGIARKGSRGKE